MNVLQNILFYYLRVHKSIKKVTHLYFQSAIYCAICTYESVYPVFRDPYPLNCNSPHMRTPWCGQSMELGNLAILPKMECWEPLMS